MALVLRFYFRDMCSRPAPCGARRPKNVRRSKAHKDPPRLPGPVMLPVGIAKAALEVPSTDQEPRLGAS